MHTSSRLIKINNLVLMCNSQQIELSNWYVILLLFIQSQDTYFVVQPNTGLTLEYFIKYTVLSKPFYTEYITSSNNTNTKGYPLYQAEISFTNPNTSNIIQISQDQNSLKVLFILGIILSSLSLVSFIVMLVMYRKSRKGNKFGEQNKSLVSSENGGSMAY